MELDLWWLFTVPVLKLAIKIAIGLVATFLFVQILRWSKQSRPKNPFDTDCRKPRKPYEHDQKKRHTVLSQPFSKDKVPDGLDAIVIGSGIGGLCTAALMAKADRRVLVLEQHDQAGGCCHSFVDKNYEFDVGIHYIGEMNKPSINKTLCDQITEGQLEWAPLDSDYDVVSIGYSDENRRYAVKSGLDSWKEYLKCKFPEEHTAIEEYFRLIDGCSKSSMVHGILKVLPLWFVRSLLWIGCYKLISFWNQTYAESTRSVVDRLTANKELRTIFTYCWGDYGTPPSRSNFSMQALLNRHFAKSGASYPVGGASEIAFNIIPVIQGAGGNVLVRANVTGIIQKGDKVCGVRVSKGSDTTEIIAPIIISSAGVYNTFLRLLPQEISERSYYTTIAKSLKPGIAAMNVFLGLKLSNEELEVRKQNVWAFTNNNVEESTLRYFELDDLEDVKSAEIPILFISFPSTKDPEWNNHPGRKGKSTATIVTLANWDWFKQWQDKSVKKRGDEYTELKDCIGHQMIEQTCQLYPQLRDNIDYIEIGSPVTNKHYLGSPNGEIYGLDHSIERFQPDMVAKLRPETDIPGLYLTGQDILSCGFTGALFSGVLTAQVCLGRNVMTDLINLHKKLNYDYIQEKKIQ